MINSETTITMKKIFSTLFVIAVAAMTFTSCEDVPSPYDYPNSNNTGKDTTNTVTPTGDGTEANPYNAAAAIEQCKAGNTNTVYVKGIISQIDEVSAQFGNATYYISEDGTTNTQFEIYRGYYLGGAKFTAEDQIKVGQEVVVCGSLMMYNTTPEMAQGSKIVSIDGRKADDTGGDTGVATGDGTQASPYNAVAANEQCKAGNTSAVYVQGIVSQVSEISTQFGNATYYISDDGKTNNEFEIFRGYYLNGDKFTSEDQLKVGQKVVVYGNLTYYNNEYPEMAQGSKIVSIDGKGTDTGGDSGDKSNIGTVSGNKITVNAADFGLASATEMGTQTLADGTVLKFDAGSNNNAPKYYSTGTTVRVYPGNTLTVTSKKKIVTIEFTCDSYNGTNYTAEGNVTANPGTVSLNDLLLTVAGINSTSTVITNAESGSGGKTQLRFSKIVITYAE